MLMESSKIKFHYITELIVNEHNCLLGEIHTITNWNIKESNVFKFTN